METVGVYLQSREGPREVELCKVEPCKVEPCKVEPDRVVYDRNLMLLS